MKVLQINSVSGTGSTGRIVNDIDTFLKSMGHESYIAYGRGTSNNSTAIRIGTKLDNYVHFLKTRIFDRHGQSSAKATKDFINQIEKLNPDVIHLHNLHGYYINIGILFKYLKQKKKNIIWTLHDCWAFTGHCAYFDYIECTRWKTGCYECPQKKNYPASAIVDNSKNNYFWKKDLFSGVEKMTLVTPSSWLSGLVKESFLKNYPVKTINNGIDLEIFKPTVSKFRQKYNLDEKTFIILGVASTWEPRKGLYYFSELSRMLDNKAKIVLVGLSEQQIRNMPDNIICIKRTHNVTELAEIYSAADVFINPTLEDNFPTTNIESLACGTPVITFNTGGSAECIKEKNGAVVEKGNLKELYREIEKIRGRGKSYYFKSCLEVARMYYDKNDRYREYMDIYIEK